MKNVAAKSRKADNPYASWIDPRTGWTYHLLKSWQANNDKPYARWFCLVEGDFTELGDCYVRELWPGLLTARRQYNGSVAFDNTVWETEGSFIAWAAGER